MARDYKHRARRKKKSTSPPGWQWGLSGFAIGLAVAAAVYVYDRRPGGVVNPVADVRAVPASARDSSPAGEPAASEERKPRFQFYDLLPKFEVVIPEAETDVRPDVRPERLTRAGSYVLQAGSFRQFQDADRMKAMLALQGLESRIQRVTIDTDSWHRVRIGPIDDLDELNAARKQLREAKIEVLVIRMGE